MPHSSITPVTPIVRHRFGTTKAIGVSSYLPIRTYQLVRNLPTRIGLRTIAFHASSSVGVELERSVQV